MRIRNRYDGQSIFWMIFCLAQIAENIDRIHDHLTRNHPARLTFDAVIVAILVALFLLFAMQPWTNYWRVTPTGILYRKLWNTKEIPFTRIAAIRPADLLGGNVEIEIAPVSKDIYPHQYLPANPSNLEAFLQAVATHAPQTLTEA